MSIARSLVTIIAGLAGVVTSGCREATPAQPPVLRLALTQPDELVIGGGIDYSFGLALAPNGRRFVFPAAHATRDSRAGLWLRDLAADSVQPLAGTTAGIFPFWSPDGGALAFFADGKLRMLTLADGSVSDLADAPSGRGGVWEADGQIIFTPRADGPLMRRMPDSTIAPFTSLEPGESSHRLPRLVGDTHVVFFVRAEEPARQGIWIAPRDQPLARKRLVHSDAEALVVDTSLVYASGNALVSQPINLEALSLSGPPQLLGTPVGRGAEHQLFATTGGEVLLFGVPPSLARELRWVDRTGAAAGAVGEPMNAFDVRIAPSGERVAVARVDPQLRTLDIWAYDSARPVPRRLSAAIDADESPAWSPDGSRVAWVSGRRSVSVRDSRGQHSEATIRKFENAVRVSDWSRDGRWIVLSELRPDTGSDIVLLSTHHAEKNRPGATMGTADIRAYAQAPFNETYGTVSPDGRWLAYASDESGRMEIYVDAFPTPGRRGRLSVGGGTEPRWMRDGTGLFFRRDAEVHFARITFDGGAPEAVSSERLFDAGADIRSFDIAPDGKRLLLNLPVPDTRAAPLTVLVHVRSLLPSAP